VSSVVTAVSKLRRQFNGKAAFPEVALVFLRVERVISTLIRSYTRLSSPFAAM